MNCGLNFMKFSPYLCSFQSLSDLKMIYFDDLTESFQSYIPVISDENASAVNDSIENLQLAIRNFSVDSLVSHEESSISTDALLMDNLGDLFEDGIHFPYFADIL